MKPSASLVSSQDRRAFACSSYAELSSELSTYSFTILFFSRTTVTVWFESLMEFSDLSRSVPMFTLMMPLSILIRISSFWQITPLFPSYSKTIVKSFTSPFESVLLSVLPNWKILTSNGASVRFILSL